MSITTTPLLPGHYYHIYNRGVNSQNIFFEERNYPFFLERIWQFFENKVNLLAYCLLPNHFHLLVHILENPSVLTHLPFSHVFNSYTQAVNRACQRTGPLLERPFKRKQITGETYLYLLVCYIHLNPNHHCIGDYKTYPWSSYHLILEGWNKTPAGVNSFLSPASVKVMQDEVMFWFGDAENYRQIHRDYRSSMQKS
jgi:putative transposase